jgi:hypothetical protein
MLFPKNRLRFTTTYQGKDDPDGWIVLDMAGADIEGASKLYLSLADLQNLKAGGDKTSARLKQARNLLGGDTELAPEDE